MQNINQRMQLGIIWMVGARLMDRSIGIVSTLILARLLTPADFGLVAMATAVGGMLDLLGAFSFDVALIQNSKAERRHYDTVWTFNVIFGLICTLGLIGLAIPASNYYHDPRLTNVMYALSVSYFINAFGNIGVVNFRKELDFKQEFILIFARRVLTFVSTITAAYILQSYWALLIGMTVGRIAGFVLSYTMNAYRPRLTLSAGKELFHFSKWMFLNNTFVYLLHDGPTFVIGRIFGASGLGIYSVSYEISNLPSTELVAPINRVTFPGFSKMQDTEVISESYLKLLGIITLLILPVGFGIAAVAQPLVMAVLGMKWIDAVQLIAVLALSGAVGATQTNNSSVWLALGRPHEVSRVLLFFLITLFSTMYLFVHKFGIVGVGYAYLAAQAVNVPLGMLTTKKLLKFSFSSLSKVVWRPIVACVLMYACVRLIDRQLVDMMPLLRLILDSAAGVVAYVVLVLALWWLSARPGGAERFCLSKLKIA